MDDDRINRIFLIHSHKLPPESLGFIRERLRLCNDESRVKFVLSQFKDPELALIFSIFFGWLGIDRFYIDSVGIGIGKLLT